MAKRTSAVSQTVTIVDEVAQTSGQAAQGLNARGTQLAGITAK
jgi:hypothetical protein